MFSNSSTNKSSSKLRKGSCVGQPDALAVVVEAAAGSEVTADCSQPVGDEEAKRPLAAAPQVSEGDGAVLGELRDACKQGCKEDSPKTTRLGGSTSPPDTAVGRDTAQHTGERPISPWRQKDISAADKQQDAKQLAAQQQHTSSSIQHSDAQPQQQQQQQHEGPGSLDECVGVEGRSAAETLMHPQAAAGLTVSKSSPCFETTSRPAAAAPMAMEQSQAVMMVQHRRWSAGEHIITQDRLLAAFPVDLGPLSHSLDSLDAVLMDTSCCFSDGDEDEHDDDELCIVASSSRRRRSSRKEVRQQRVPAARQQQPGVEEVAAAAVAVSGPSAAGCCVLDLQDLLAIVLDVMNDKQAADKRCGTHHRPSMWFTQPVCEAA